MRLIDADELIEELIKCESSIYKITSELILGVKSGYRKAIVQVEHAPTIDAEPVRHGEWTDTGIEELDLIYSGYKCSQCGFILCGDHTKYCPGCGTKMDKKSPENHKKYQEEETNKKSFK